MQFWNIPDPVIPYKINSYTVYPNPSEGNLTILRDQGYSNEILLEVFSITGVKLYSRYLKSGEQSINLDISFLSNGVYYLRVNDLNGYYFQKIIIQK